MLRHPTAQELMITAAAADFLDDLANADRLAHTCANYCSDLAAFARCYDGPLSSITVDVLRGYLAILADLAPADPSP